jgi:hypothetical protein
MRAVILAITTVILTGCASTVTITCAGPSHDDWQDCDAKATEICPHGYETVGRKPAPEGSAPTTAKYLYVSC